MTDTSEWLEALRNTEQHGEIVEVRQENDYLIVTYSVGVSDTYKLTIPIDDIVVDKI
jgi:hypothetical protein